MKIIGDEENLKKEIIQDAERKQKQTVKKAESEAKKIIKNAKDDAQTEYDKIKNNALEHAKKEKNRVLSSIPQAVKKKNIEMMNSLVDEVMNELKTKIKDIDSNTVKPIEISLLKQGVDQLEQGEYVVNISTKSLISEKDLKQFEEKNGIKLKLNKNKDQGYGVIISGENNRMALDNTISGYIARDIEEVRYIVYDVLFSELEKELKERDEK